MIGSGVRGASVQEIADEVGRLVAPMIGRRFYVCFSEPAAPPEEVFPHVPEHLRHVIGWERQGVLFAGGPFLDPDGRPGERAMFVLRADTEEQARDLAAAEPLHALGLRTFTLHPWQLNEGRVSLHLEFSRQTGGLDGPPVPGPGERTSR